MLYATPEHRRPGGTLYWAVIREMVPPSLLALFVLIVVLLTQDLIGFSELMINRGLGFRSAASFIFFEIVPLVSIALPFATLVGCLVGLGRMGADRELLVLEASGISSPRLIGPVLLYAGVLTVVGLMLALYAVPWSNRSLELSLADIARTSPGAKLQPGVVQKYGDWKLTAREVSASGAELRGVLVWMPGLGETVFARRGTLTPDPEGAFVKLFDGSVVLDPRKRPRQVRFESMVMRLPRAPDPIGASSGNALAGLSLAALAHIGSEPSVPPFERGLADSELQRRFARPLATLVLGLLAVPLFFSRAHFSRAGGGVMGIVATLMYYGLIELADGITRVGRMSPTLGVWLPNLLMGALGIFLAFRLTRTSSIGRHSDRPTSSREEKKPVSVKPRSVRSRRHALPRYVSVRFVELALLCFGGLLAAYFLVDLVERADFLSRSRPNLVEFATFYGARLPLLAARVAPMALLLAAALTVSLLGAQGELIGMRANGIPAPVALAPVLLICFLVAPLYFAFSDWVLPESNALYRQLKDEANRQWSGTSSRAAVWYRVGDQVYEAEALDSREGTARNIIVYEIDDEGRPYSRVDARRASHIGGGIWRLEDPMRVDFSRESIREAPAGPYASLGHGLEVRVDTRHLSVSELAREIDEVEENGYDATAFRVAYFMRWAAPLGCVILPMLALLFAMGGPPFPTASLTVVMGVVAAVSYVLFTGVAASFGNGGVLPPAAAAFAPPALFAGLALVLGWRLRNLGRR